MGNNKVVKKMTVFDLYLMEYSKPSSVDHFQKQLNTSDILIFAIYFS